MLTWYVIYGQYVKKVEGLSRFRYIFVQKYLLIEILAHSIGPRSHGGLWHANSTPKFTRFRLCCIPLYLMRIHGAPFSDADLAVLGASNTSVIRHENYLLFNSSFYIKHIF